ncbi:MAG: hypothetical protein ABSF54_14800 [Bryobacteraceae bacterium]
MPGFQFQTAERRRAGKRIDEPDKNWKFSLADIHERKYWKAYMQAYDAARVKHFEAPGIKIY